MAGVVEETPDEAGIHQWLSQADFPNNLRKYWFQRYKIWDKYDQGIWMTEDAWFGVTPEPIANKIAAHLGESVPKEKTVIIDAFAGVGGNAIAFALSGRWEQVFAIEKDAKTMKCAKHNASIYGVQNKIFWVKGDCFDVISKRFAGKNNNVIFASPPWGGTEYSADDVFDLSRMEPYNLDKLYKGFSRYSTHLCLFLPRTSDLNQIAQYAPKDKKLEVAHYCIVGASKALCVYFGDFDFGHEDEADDVKRIEQAEVAQD
ncbi:S-adenosyl-L-methionine-dependent methyltransferase [Pleomassaria siparia CBS 279.74]|uniref:Trimethylguanosine synthase n=1 Tax=Pleomassaria siparia CBS 279.74 TaxID=1314801 RepID=A0A6G1K3C4_9PLEO|nr:S-adenosyl-L-methionine-dependent methyltransferase [Pleomassaria siparia CBS 279.74]